MSALCRTPRLGELQQSITRGGQTIAVTTTFRKSHKNSLERRAGAYLSSCKRNTLYLPVHIGYISPTIIFYHEVFWQQSSDNRQDSCNLKVPCGARRRARFDHSWAKHNQFMCVQYCVTGLHLSA